MPATTASSPRSPNAPRHRPESGRGHYESWFLRANEPGGQRALWLKATILHEPGREAIAEAWCATFGFAAGPPLAAKATSLRRAARIGGDPVRIEVAGCRFQLGPRGSSAGAIIGADGRRHAWEIAWEPAGGPLAAPLSLLPADLLIDAPLPSNKLLTPAPCLRFSGRARVGAERVVIEGWTGMQGHNWGRSHAPRYAWGHALFEGADGGPLVVAEGFTGQIRRAGLLSAPISALVVRRGERQWRFDRLIDLWRQRARIGDLEWSLHIRGPAGDATLSMRAEPDKVVCLGYHNPDGSLAYCLNSKLARALLRVNPADGDGFECISDSGGALEILGRDPDPRFPIAA